MLKFLILILFICSTVISLDKIRADNETTFLYDQFGRIRIFRGVNQVYKAFPWYSQMILNNTILDDLEVK